MYKIYKNISKHINSTTNSSNAHYIQERVQWWDLVMQSAVSKGLGDFFFFYISYYYLSINNNIYKWIYK